MNTENESDMNRDPVPPSNGRPSEMSPQAAPRQVILRLPTARPVLTYALLAINVLIFLYYFSLPPAEEYQFLYDWGKINSLIRDGEYYRLLSAMFLHLDLPHIFFNSWALYMLGRNVEGLFGTPRFAVIYLLGGLSGSLASFVFTDALSVGASGAIMAIVGADLVYFYFHRELHGAAGQQHLRQLVFLMLLVLVQGFISEAGVGKFGIDNAGHAGGLFGGLVLAWFISPAFKLEKDTTVESGIVLVDDNPPERWVLPSVLYAVGLLVTLVYALAVG